MPRDGHEADDSPSADATTHDTPVGHEPGRDEAGSSPANEPVEGNDSADTSAGERYLEDYRAGLEEVLNKAAGSQDTNADVDDTQDDTQDDAAGVEAEGQNEGGEQTSEGQTESGSESEQAATADADKDADTAEAADDNADDEVSPEEDLPFNTHPRFRKLIAQRNDLKAQTQEFEGRVTDLEPRASQYDQIQDYMRANELSARDVAEGFRIMALMSQDPVKAREAMAEHMQKLDQFTGRVLPPDLQQQVDNGLVTEELAGEQARMRNQQAFDSERANRQSQQFQQQQQAQQVEAARSQQRQAVTDWEARVSKRDPDYQRKQPWVVKEMRLLVAEQPPQTPDDAVRLAQQAHDNVSAQLASMLPQRREVRPSATSADSAANTAVTQPPGSYMEAIQRAAAQQG